MATRILIIDDDVELCALLREFLGAEGYEVEARHAGGDAAACAANGRYALIVLDVMPKATTGSPIHLYIDFLFEAPNCHI